MDQTYELKNFLDCKTNNQTITFFTRDGDKVIDGTTNEEVIKMLIKRIESLDIKFHCHQNIEALSALQMALSCLEQRTRERMNRGVEGKLIE